MTREVYDFEAEVEVLSPLHVGSGMFGMISSVKGKDGANTQPQVALISRDAMGRPYIPATTLKGLYRRMLEANGTLDGDAQGLLGNIRNESTGRIGALRARPAIFLSTPDGVSNAPFAEDANHGVFIAARTAVDRDSGTADDSHLYFQETVAPGVRFSLRASIEVRNGNAKALALRFAGVWRSLGRVSGWQIGKGQADGSGAIRLNTGSVRVKHRALDASGDFTAKVDNSLWQKAEPIDSPRLQTETFHLICPGPFIVVDSSKKLKHRDGEAPSQTAQIQPQTLNGQPLLLGSSISGALRARAEWLEALIGLNTASDMTPSERLFGTTGFRGLLSVSDIIVSNGVLRTLTSVKLDRFSGAPVDNALFKTKVFFGVRLCFELRLEQRGKTVPTQDDLNLFNQLVENIKNQGLMLGHGNNKGFGWFEAVKGDENAHS